MRLKETLTWARAEWGIIREGRRMDWRARRRWLSQWVPFGARTVGWAIVSLTAGPLTGGTASTWAARKWSRASARGLRIEIRVSGHENVPEGPFVYASNHASLLDILVLGASLPGDFKWAAKRSVMHVPFLGWHLRLAGHVPVDRGRGQGDAITRAFVSVLRAGKPLLVFPEGTRTFDGRLRPFKSGAFRAAVLAGVPVVPVALHGTFDLMSRDAVDTGETERTRVVAVEIGRPLQPGDGVTGPEAVNRLRDHTRAAIAEMLGRVRLCHCARTSEA